PRRGGCNDLQWYGTPHLRVVLRSGLQHVVGAEIHHYELSPIKETEAVRAGFQNLSADFERDFIEQISLVFLLDGRGVARTVNHGRENKEIVGKMHATAIAKLHRSALAAEENASRENFWSDIRRLEDNFLPFSWR